MTDEQARDIGRRALAAGYRWAPGALDVDSGRRVDHICACGEPIWIVLRELADRGYCGHHADWGSTMGRTDDTPDFRDPATLGTLIAQVRERWGQPLLHVRCYILRDDDGLAIGHEYMLDTPGVWGSLKDGYLCLLGRFATEIEAWVAALESAP